MRLQVVFVLCSALLCTAHLCLDNCMLIRFKFYQNALPNQEFPFTTTIQPKIINTMKHMVDLKIIDPPIPKDMFRLVCLVKLVFFAREGVAF